ncbi:hypothetical protein KKF34_10230 [Myxococcota bacterium]|nr:hypothetical protein [Myxococcota bacterium]MBU1382666.1 hypothetical protein [Myxococcota bacterium]MBU1497242.1 hypothetical protein [Myxococcota bacterium]
MIKDLAAWLYMLTFVILIGINTLPQKPGSSRSPEVSKPSQIKGKPQARDVNKIEKAIKTGQLSDKKALFYRESK